MKTILSRVHYYEYNHVHTHDTGTSTTETMLVSSCVWWVWAATVAMHTRSLQRACAEALPLVRLVAMVDFCARCDTEQSRVYETVSMTNLPFAQWSYRVRAQCTSQSNMHPPTSQTDTTAFPISCALAQEVANSSFDKGAEPCIRERCATSMSESIVGVGSAFIHTVEDPEWAGSEPLWLILGGIQNGSDPNHCGSSW